MPIENKSEADTFAEEQGNRKELMETIDLLIMSISPTTIRDFLKSRAGNQAFMSCFWGFAWLKIVG